MVKARKRAWITKSSVAAVLGTSLFMMGQGGYAAAAASPTQVVQLANQLVGTPYQASANGPQAFDSAGYVAYVYDQLGVDLPDSISGLYKAGTPVDKDELKPGDVLFFNSSSGSLNYVGIYLGDNRFTYASRSQGKVIVKDFSAVAHNLAGARRYIESEQPAGSSPQKGDGSTPAPVSEFSADVVRYAQAELGKPYRSGGNGPSGFDSAGFVAYVLGKAGVQADDSLSALYKMGQAVASHKIQAGDVVFFYASSGTSLNYAGIYVGEGKFVYASRSQGKVVEQSFDSVAKRFAGARRITKNDSVTKPETGHSGNGSVTKPSQPAEQPQQPQQPKESSSTLADRIIATGERFLGTPYKFGAEYETSGKFDCSSFTQYVYKLNGIQLPRDSRQQSTVGREISKSELRKGDLVFFRSSGSTSNRITHVAIYAGNDRLLHTYGSPGVTYTKFSGTSWEKRVVMMRRVLP